MPTRKGGTPHAGSGDAPLLVFDGDCGFCTWAARWAARGFRRGERIEPWQRLAREELDWLGLDPDEVKRAAWWAAPGQAPERGHRAIGRALRAGGGWRQVAGLAFLTLPTSLVAAVAYRLVARWRGRLPGTVPACRADGD